MSIPSLHVRAKFTCSYQVYMFIPSLQGSYQVHMFIPRLHVHTKFTRFIPSLQGSYQDYMFIPSLHVRHKTLLNQSILVYTELTCSHLSSTYIPPRCRMFYHRSTMVEKRIYNVYSAGFFFCLHWRLRWNCFSKLTKSGESVKPNPVSQHVWHDKDPALLKSHWLAPSKGLYLSVL